MAWWLCMQKLRVLDRGRFAAGKPLGRPRRVIGCPNNQLPLGIHLAIVSVGAARTTCAGGRSCTTRCFKIADTSPCVRTPHPYSTQSLLAFLLAASNTCSTRLFLEPYSRDVVFCGWGSRLGPVLFSINQPDKQDSPTCGLNLWWLSGSQ